MKWLEHAVGALKGMKEYPAVQKLRELGQQFGSTELFRIEHKAFDCRWLYLNEDHIPEMADAFEQRIQEIQPELKQVTGEDTVDVLQLAYDEILIASPKFATDSAFLEPPATSPSQDWFDFGVLTYGAAFLASNGILNVSELTRSNFLWVGDGGPPLSIQNRAAS